VLARTNYPRDPADRVTVAAKLRGSSDGEEKPTEWLSSVIVSREPHKLFVPRLSASDTAQRSISTIERG